MISIKPSEMMRLESSSYAWQSPESWLLYDHFAKRCVDWMDTRRGRCCYEVLIDTSGVGFWYLEKMTRKLAAQRVLAKLFAEVGRDSLRGEFLRFCKIKRWSDLDRPIEFRCRLPHDFGRHPWFDVRGRRLRDSPNQYHPEAVWVHHGQAKFSVHYRRWYYSLNYSYEWEASGSSCGATTAGCRTPAARSWRSTWRASP